VLHYWSNMKTATVRELRNRYTQLLEWIDAGEEIRITRRGIVIARLVPENRARVHPGVDWIRSAAFALDRLNLRPLKAEQTEKLLDDNKGPF
jgi:antitoxin (DNA-binding transcriptional repressor) of toxin-antitoxin stability system